MTVFWKLSHFLYEHHLRMLGRVFEFFNYILGSNAISAKAKIGKGTRFLHRGVGCVVHFNATIGENCEIFPNVMIGDSYKGGITQRMAPKIGNNVFIGTGAILLGEIKVGDGAVIGANAVVLKDVKPGTRVVGIPAKEI